MSVALSVVFTGLCVLVTARDRDPGQVLLLDANGVGEVDGMLLPEHAPTLVMSLGSLANAETSNPTRVVGAWPTVSAGGPAAAVEQFGIWDLRGTEVRIRTQEGEMTGLRRFQPSDGASSWPRPPSNLNDPDAWRDLRFVADMTMLVPDARIDPALIAADRASSERPRAIATRIHLDGGSVEAGMPSQQIHRDATFEFSGAGTGIKARQALTDTLRWRLDSDGDAVVIEIVPVDGGPIKRLVLAPSETPHGVFVSNLPTENVRGHAHQALGDEQIAALHFGAYYKLLATEPSEKPLPRKWAAAPADRGTGFVRTAFCIPVEFRLLRGRAPNETRH